MIKYFCGNMGHFFNKAIYNVSCYSIFDENNYHTCTLDKKCILKTAGSYTNLRYSVIGYLRNHILLTKIAFFHSVSYFCSIWAILQIILKLAIYLPNMK